MRSGVQSSADNVGLWFGIFIGECTRSDCLSQNGDQKSDAYSQTICYWRFGAVDRSNGYLGSCSFDGIGDGIYRAGSVCESVCVFDVVSAVQ